MKAPAGAGARLRLWVLGIAAMFLAALLWGGMDGYAGRYLVGTIGDLGLIYATARGINALVSVLQGTEIDLPMLTLTLGELLDPVNDLIERFSGVLTFALGALILQQVMLAVLSDTAVTWVLAAAVAGVGLLSLAAGPGVNRQLLRLLLVTVFVRFSLGIVVGLNSLVDARFLPSSDSEQHRQMVAFKGNLEEMKSMVDGRESSDQQLAELQRQLEDLDALLAGHGETRRALEREQAAVEQQITQICDRLPWWRRCTVDNADDPALAGRLEDRARLREQRRELDGVIGGFREEREQLAGRLECLAEKSRGGDCGLFEWLGEMEPRQLVASRLELLENRVSYFVDNALNLLVSALLKSVLIPLLFLYALIVVTRKIWRRVGELPLA